MTILEATAEAPAVLIPAPRESRERIRRDVSSAALIRHPGLAEVTSVAVVDSGVSASYVVPVSARPVTHGEDLSPEQAVRLLAPVAAGLALLHDAERTHGAVGSDRLWARADGVGVLGPGPGAGAPTDDVRDFLLMLDSLLPQHSVGSDIAQLLIAGADPDPRLRPSMARVAAVLDAASRRFLTSPPAHRRVPVTPAAAASPLPAVAAPRRHARHAASAPVGHLPGWLSWRMAAAALGIAVAGLIGVNVMSTSGTPNMCPVESK